MQASPTPFGHPPPGFGAARHFIASVFRYWASSIRPTWLSATAMNTLCLQPPQQRLNILVRAEAWVEDQAEAEHHTAKQARP